MPLLLKKRSSLLHTDLSARRIVNEVDQLSDLMQKHSQLQNGTLRIGLLWVASYLNLSHILTDYHRIYPGISYSLTVDGSNTLLQMLDSRSINAAFVISSEAALQHKEDIFFHRIMDDRYVAIVSRQNPLSDQPYISMQDLQSENIIMPAKELSLIHISLLPCQPGWLRGSTAYLQNKYLPLDSSESI